ncbi:MAG: hypothetical protein AAF433_20945, partial [Bacteroidota bacterium]
MSFSPLESDDGKILQLRAKKGKKQFTDASFCSRSHLCNRSDLNFCNPTARKAKQNLDFAVFFVHSWSYALKKAACQNLLGFSLAS